MNLLLFLGAGFSVEAGLPTQKEFWKHASEHPQISQYAKTIIDQIFYETALSSSDIPTIENAFSFIDFLYYMKYDDFNISMFFPPIHEVSVLKARNTFLRVIELVYSYNRAEEMYINHALYDVFFKKLLKSNHTAIITTNYDLICESILNRLPGGKAILFPIINKDYKFGGAYIPAPLLKLHGSVDWKETNFDVPNIIPPTWSKRFERRGKYNYIWNQAEYAINVSDKIVFIGYSMPKLDIHIRYLIKLGLLNSENKKEVYVVKPTWNNEDEENYNFINNHANIKSLKSIKMGFKQFAESDMNQIL